MRTLLSIAPSMVEASYFDVPLPCSRHNGFRNEGIGAARNEIAMVVTFLFPEG
jgi:hypothetical protein